MASDNESGEVVRWAMGVEYLGTAGDGWQSQADGQGIADCFVAALRRITPCNGSLVAAGRTDAGVHASSQVIHLDLPPGRSERAWILGMNTELPHDIRVCWARLVDQTFHARFSAIQRNYLYLLCNQPVFSAFRRGRMAWERRPLDIRAMQAAADTLTGEKDFSAFRSARCSSRTSARDLQQFRIRHCDGIVSFEISANAFLHNMCRVLVGSLWKVGLGQWPVEKIPQILESGDRTQAGRTAPAEGLYFLGPDYPSQYELPQRISSQQLLTEVAAAPVLSDTKIN